MKEIAFADTRREPKFVNASAWPPGTNQAEIKMSPDRASNESFNPQTAVGAVTVASDSRRVKRRMQGQARVKAGAAENAKAKELQSSSKLAWLPDVEAMKPRRAKLLVAGVEVLVLKSLPERLSETFFSQTFGIEIRELHSAFLKIRGVGLYAALRTLRIAEVKRRLDANEALSVDAAMRQCGFASYAWFRKEFLERFKIDPKIYRKASSRKAPDSRNVKRTKAREFRNVICGVRSVNR